MIVPVIRPKLPDDRLTVGLPKCGLLKMLKNSDRNSTWWRSVMKKVLNFTNPRSADGALPRVAEDVWIGRVREAGGVEPLSNGLRVLQIGAGDVGAIAGVGVEQIVRDRDGERGAGPHHGDAVDAPATRDRVEGLRRGCQ